MSTLNHQYLIDKILAMGCSPLPVAPQMLSANGSPSKITGKNPSYIDVLNRHYIVSHKQFQNKQPSSSTLTSWFSNPQNGIGILCSDTVVCIDIDSKNFDSIDACNAYYAGLLESYTILNSAWNERSQSGGYHIIIRLKSPKTFTNFSDRPGGKQIGEVLGYGRFVVLAPTIGPSGNAYTCLNFPDELPEIERLEAIGVYSTKSNSDINIPTIPEALEISSHPEVKVSYSQTTVGTNNVPKKTKKSLSPLQGLADFPLYLPDLISERSRAILNGDIFAEQGERSDCLITLLNELAGWLNWGKKNQVNIVDNLRELSHIAGGLLGLDSDRIDRIIDSIDWGRAYPAAYYKGGDDACWKKVAQVHSRKGAKVKNPASTFLQRAVEEIYGDDFLICCTGKLYRWVGTHYEYLPEAEEIGRIRNYCNEYCVTKNDQITFPYAKPKVVKEVWEWVKMVNPVSPERLRPKGINCLNGVLEIDWVDNKPIIKLEEHNPYKHFFINPPQILYNPDADSTACDKLLSCLDTPSQEILLRNLGASLDLAEVRKRVGRMVKLLLLIGDGSNGKDSLREVVSIIYGGVGMTSKSLDDFCVYDDGRKFILAGLERARVNWASESTKTSKLDDSKSLKAFATGDVLQCERKFEDAFDFVPEAIGLFNLNALPNVYGTTQAGADRFAPLVFKKTFVTADKFDTKNERHALADARFKYDPLFVKNEVAPAFLNRMIKGLQDLISTGIDYSVTEQAMEEIRESNNHLFEFAADYGLDYEEGNLLTVDEIWLRLERWYKDQEILQENDFGDRTWADPTRPGDKYLKGKNQVIPRFLALFPKGKKTVMIVRENEKQKKITGIEGISFSPNTKLDKIEIQQEELQKISESQPESIQSRLAVNTAIMLVCKENQFEPQSIPQPLCMGEQVAEWPVGIIIEYVKSQDEISEIEMAEIWLFSGIEKQMQLKQLDLEIAKLLEDCCKRHLI